ncbi:MAG: rhomboid family intramembrane serine protease [Sedimentisphaerales bacterium]|nr:rhomboid family intramembrane serine protease [Sedimentisphaerales bacterium]
MLLPIRTNIWPRRTPYANYALIAINVVIFLASYGGPYRYLVGGQMVNLPIRPWAVQWLLVPAHRQYWQFLTYAFLHGSLVHILGNMFFLYLFGNNINDKLGHLWYLLFYLCGAVLSGLGHAVVNWSSITPTLGASGAVAAVTGAYVVLFPQTLITVLYWFFFIGTVEVPALYFIGIKMILIDNGIARYTPGVAYDAHLAGYAYGIAITLLLLATRLVSGSNFDLWAMIKKWNRRRRYRDVVADGFDPFAATGQRKAVVASEVKKSAAETQREAKTWEIRSSIGRWIGQRNLAAAADAYLELMEVDSQQVLPRQDLLDVANQLASDHRSAEAAQAYEQFLTHYGNYEHAEQVELMLGILYSRYLRDSEQAVKHLEKAVQRLSDPGQLQMCREELARLRD